MTDLAASRAFYVDTLGLQVTHEDADSHLSARDGRARASLHRPAQVGRGLRRRAGLQGLFDEPDLDRAEAFFRGKGLPVEWVERPFMGRTLRTRDPFGIPLEFYVKMDRLPPIHQKYALYKGVKPLRIDHFNMFARDVDGSVAFYNEIGFRVDRIYRG